VNNFLNKFYQTGQNNTLNIFLTGSTGILGSHLLFELLPLYVNKILQGKIVLMVRPDRKFNPYERIKNIFSHPTIPEGLKEIPMHDLLRHLFIIDSGLSNFSASMLPKGIDNYTVIHAASSVNLGQNESTNKEIEENNFNGTLHLLQEISGHAKQFIFVSTAYSSGHRIGEIGDDFLSMDEYLFRNPYEQYKLQTEKFIKNYCTSKSIEWKIFRPSIICGRLIDPPYFVISRFLVFYLFARYAVAMKNRLTNTHIRLHVPKHSGINIVPVDFVAKALVLSLWSPVQQLNVVHKNNVSCRSLFRNGFGLIHFENFSFLDEMPQNINPVEKMLYSTVGQQLGPYIDTPDHYFDTSVLSGLTSDINLPEIEDHFCSLLEFATSRKFVPLY
jgi:nucleoside-diphosphate-sugar epimerase